VIGIVRSAWPSGTVDVFVQVDHVTVLGGLSEGLSLSNGRIIGIPFDGSLVFENFLGGRVARIVRGRRK